MTVFLFTTYLAFVADKESKAIEAKLSEDGVQRVDIIVDSYSFEPNQIIVVVNKPVEITLKSVTTVVPHNFTINYPEAGLNIDQDISPGEEVKVTFTPTKTGTFEFYCDKKGLFGSHQKKGMKGTLEIK
jgi:heme/copper-type cytochrome/quinol oxidase subunit 2